jgi:hypothetical protein
MEFAAAEFDRIVIMREGVVIDDGPPGRVLAARNEALLGTTGLTPPPAARLAAALGLDAVPATAPALVQALLEAAPRA